MSLDHLIASLKATRLGSGWVARCPTHPDRKPSLSISVASSGKVLVHCHAGCAQADVVEQLRRDGLWPDPGRTGHQGIGDESTRRPCRRALPHEGALRIWDASGHAAATPVEAYLSARGITIAVPAALRFHRDLKHPTGTRWPCMVALIRRGVDGERVAIHRTFLSSDDAGKAPVEPQKMMLGPCAGGAVMLADADDLVLVGEGIESCLSAMQATGQPAWAALSTSGLKALELPDRIKTVVLLADGDATGEAAAVSSAHRWRREGRRVRIARPPVGMDFNDLLNSGEERPRRVA